MEGVREAVGGREGRREGGKEVGKDEGIKGGKLRDGYYRFTYFS